MYHEPRSTRTEIFGGLALAGAWLLWKVLAGGQLGRRVNDHHGHRRRRAGRERGAREALEAHPADWHLVGVGTRS